LPLIGFLFPSAYLTSGSLLALSLPSSVCSTYRFSQPYSGLLRPDAYRPYFMPNPLMGFSPSESSPSKDSERLSAPNYRHNLGLNVNPLEDFTKSIPPERKIDGGFHGFSPFGNPFLFNERLNSLKNRYSHGLWPF